ncbi:hypothetical protein GCM10007079_16000 [Nocardiopsis terrae]|uniref:Helix-turn-helix domain-containing protein n=1 Tax=Nocardiopsis terrae TaxID=372655 RepID=A0ABR9HIB5_9ACTN|nr:hypothetical protein [Nocardiopsis terrae]MBE1458770.1 hypothetical protein [Nocardiopsis terrae]GHC78584.1 hypothetical protein GCM10007079_16000 [Nocardiopsis terrae]
MLSPDEPTRLVTLAEWAREHGLSESYALRQLPYQVDDFPAPETTRTLIRYQHAEPIDLPDHDSDSEVTLTGFARVLGVSAHLITQTRDKDPSLLPDPLPPPTRPTRGRPTHRYRLGDLLTWWNNRPPITRGSVQVGLYDPVKLAPFEPRRNKPVELSGHDPNSEVTLGRFATLIGLNRSTVSQYKRKTPDALPDTVEGYRHDRLPPYTRAKFRLGDLLNWWNSRPGSVAGYRSQEGGTASPRHAPQTPATDPD